MKNEKIHLSKINATMRDKTNNQKSDKSNGGR